MATVIRGVWGDDWDIEFDSRVCAHRGGLLQCFARRCGCAEVAAAWRSAGPPGVATQFEDATIGQFKGHRAADASVELLSGKQAVAFDQYTLDTLWRNCDNLANKAFYDGGNSAHLTLQTFMQGSAIVAAMWLCHLGLVCLNMWRKL
ncbi:hypothetical protein EMIT047CA2_230070 [Pseudomonas soli]